MRRLKASITRVTVLWFLVLGAMSAFAATSAVVLANNQSPASCWKTTCSGGCESPCVCSNDNHDCEVVVSPQ